MRYTRIYMEGGENGKADPTDYVIGYRAENGKKIEVVSLINTSAKWYKVDGWSYDTLKEAKKHIEEEEEK